MKALHWTQSRPTALVSDAVLKLNVLYYRWGRWTLTPEKKEPSSTSLSFHRWRVGGARRAGPTATSTTTAWGRSEQPFPEPNLRTTRKRCPSVASPSATTWTSPSRLRAVLNVSTTSTGLEIAIIAETEEIGADKDAAEVAVAAGEAAVVIVGQGHSNLRVSINACLFSISLSST